MSINDCHNHIRIFPFKKMSDDDTENNYDELDARVKQTTTSESFQKKSGENDGKQATVLKAGCKRKPLYQIIDDESDEENNEHSLEEVCYSSASN